MRILTNEELALIAGGATVPTDAVIEHDMATFADGMTTVRWDELKGDITAETIDSTAALGTWYSSTTAAWAANGADSKTKADLDNFVDHQLSLNPFNWTDSTFKADLNNARGDAATDRGHHSSSSASGLPSSYSSSGSGGDSGYSGGGTPGGSGGGSGGGGSGGSGGGGSGGGSGGGGSGGGGGGGGSSSW